MTTSTPTQKKLSKENLIQLISDKNTEVLFSKENGKGHISKVWLNFSTVFVSNVKQDYVICNSCMSLITYKHSAGTVGTQKHIESCLQMSFID